MFYRLISWLCLFILSASPGLGQDALRVVSTMPTSNALAVDPGTELVIQVTTPLDTTFWDTTSLTAFGRWSGPISGHIRFEDQEHQIRFIPDRPFAAGERVTVQLARHVQGQSGATMPYAYAWQFWIRTSPASLDLVEVQRLSTRRSNEAGIVTYGAYAGDLDKDGYTDFVVPNEASNDIRVFMNDGTGHFSGQFEVYPVPNARAPSTNEGADFDLDGDIDFVVGSTRNNRVGVFWGTGTGAFENPQSYTVETGVRGLSVLDLDGDGYTDVVTANEGPGNLSILHNNTDGTFNVLPPLLAPGEGERATDVADFNMDGVLDLAVGAILSEEMLVMLGNGEGSLFFHSRASSGGQTWMIATGDVNGDGYADVVSANSNENTAGVLLGNGRGGLQNAVTYPVGAFPIAIDLGDLDGDDDLDMVVSSFGSGDWTIYFNNGTGDFGRRRTIRAFSAGSCAVLHDRDNNGTLDMTGIDEIEDLIFLFSNSPVTTVTEHPDHLPTSSLEIGYPNPFARHINLTYTVAKSGSAHLVVYDLLGREVKTLISGAQTPGRHHTTWDGTDASGYSVADGLYLVRLKTNDHVSAQTISLTR